ncbi:ribonuclease H-like domain-containing protein [bacterium]|nr:ribonuclease H-like domain-containing protein [bacterium]
MPRDDLKKRIEALNKKPLKNVPEAKQTAKPAVVTTERVAYSRSVPTLTANPQPIQPSKSGKPVKLEDVVDGIITQAPVGPGYYLVEMPATSLDACAGVMYEQFLRLTGYPDGTAVERLARACKSESIAPEEIIFMDLETTGLSMTPLFLIGTMEVTPDGLHFKQYFARDYSEEVSIITAYAERMRSARMVVTFNGKSFDVPFLSTRALAAGVKCPAPEFHLDLLHESRRVYKHDLPNCRLQTLEQMVCGRCREDDIPGAEIPQAYHDFVRSGDAGKIAQILYHNLYDLLTMADLMHRMWHRD